MLTMLVRGLPSTTTQQSFEQMFAKHGRVFDVTLASDIFTGKCKGFGTVSMEGHEARAAIGALNGSTQDGAFIRVTLDDGRKKRKR